MRPAAPSAGWEVVGDPARLGLALPAGFASEDLDVMDGVEGALHHVPDGSVLVTETRFTGVLAGAEPPEETLENAVPRAIGGGRLEDGVRRDLVVAGRPAPVSPAAGSPGRGLPDRPRTLTR